jgi:hypothetical protein
MSLMLLVAVGSERAHLKSAASLKKFTKKCLKNKVKTIVFRCLRSALSKKYMLLSSAASGG